MTGPKGNSEFSFGRSARFDCRSYSRHSHSTVKEITFSQFFSSFESGGITKHLTSGPSGNNEFCFPSTICLFKSRALSRDPSDDASR